MEYYSAIKRNAFESVLMKQIKLEQIIQNEVSQKEKHKYYISMHTNGVWKDRNNDPVCKVAKENRLLDSGRRKGWDDLRE